MVARGCLSQQHCATDNRSYQVLNTFDTSGDGLVEGAAIQILAASTAAIYLTDDRGRITYYNEAAAALWGYRPILGTSEWCGSWKLRYPDG
ncbi:PAS domain-containing protein, partial [Pseudaminobacter sp. NGMCC 1.201702]|uniref:PAS domain-containing protein n=1 Tax=Pseudaminobacter sp. NGMCC 1.201702 TaxID=3391825 RepID=UPI0039EFB745